MSDFTLKGRMGVELSTVLKGCCVDSILAWRPALVGQKNRCLYCDNVMKTVRAGEVNLASSAGFVTDLQKSADPELIVGEVCFSKKRFPAAADVQEWCAGHEFPAFKNILEEEMVWRVKLASLAPDTSRAVWAATGVVAVLGLEKIDTGNMASGGQVNPSQGAPADDKKDETTEEPETDAMKDLLSAFKTRLETLVRR